MGTELVLADFKATTPVTIETDEQPIAVSVQDIRKWIAPEAPEGEALKFLLQCRAARLNPFLGDAYLLPRDNRKTGERKYITVFAKAAYLKAAQRHPLYGGYEAGIIVEPKDPKRKGEHRKVAGTIRPEDCTIVGGWCRAYRKDSPFPVEVDALLSEYRSSNPGPWQDHPGLMIRKVAIVGALREAFAMGEVYDVDEFKDRIVPNLPWTTGSSHNSTRDLDEPAGVVEAEETPQEPPTPSLSGALHDELEGLRAAAKVPEYQWLKLLARFGATDSWELTDTQATALIQHLRGVVDRLPKAPRGNQ